MLTYNNKLVHSTTGYRPNEASKKGNSLDVKLNLEAKSKKTQGYPDIGVGNNVKILRKKKVGEKERSSVWGDKGYEVLSIGMSIGQKYNTLKDLSKEYLRNEILTYDNVNFNSYYDEHHSINKCMNYEINAGTTPPEESANPWG